MKLRTLHNVAGLFKEGRKQIYAVAMAITVILWPALVAATVCRVDVYENSDRLRTSIPVRVPYQMFPLLEVEVPDVGPEDTVQVHAQSQVSTVSGKYLYGVRVMVAWFLMRSEAPRSPVVLIPLE